jgi:hypothetical protein
MYHRQRETEREEGKKEGRKEKYKYPRYSSQN